MNAMGLGMGKVVVAGLLLAGISQGVMSPVARAQTSSPATSGAASPGVPPGTAIVSPPVSTAPHYDLQPPVFGGGSNSVYDLNVSSTQNGPAGTIAVTNTAPPPAYSFEQYAREVHGYVSTGVSSTGGHEFSGGVNLPLVPGTADLDVGVGTGQTGSYKVAGTKLPSLGYDTYYAGLHLHPADNIDAYIGIRGLRVNGPQPW
jgi:hypothetical protein